jgi:hypothetical protein
VQTLQTHYYFNDTSHSMNEAVYIHCKSAIHNTLQDLSKEFGIELNISVIAREEGGIKDVIEFCTENKNTLILGVSTTVIAGIITGIILHHYTTNPIDNYKKELSFAQLLEDTGLSIEDTKELYPDADIERICKIANKAINLPKTKNNFSKFYKKLDSINKVTKVSLCKLDVNNKPINEEEHTVYKRQFSDFIKTERIEKDTDEDATILLISPVLKASTRYKWRGVYKEELIEFTVADESFKNDVYAKRISFSSEHILSVELEITTKFDDDNNIVSTTYKALTVLSGYDAIEESEYTTLAGSIKAKEKRFVDLNQDEFRLTSN